MSKQAACALIIVSSLAFCAHLVGCSRDVETSVGASRQHAPMLAGIASQDVEELRKGMPEGAALLVQTFQGRIAAKDDLPEVRHRLDQARNKIQDLRVAKSTFFALADRDGTILRTDREPDTMSGKNLFTAYPPLKEALNGKLVQGRGSMAEASTVKGRADGQFVMAVPVAAGPDVLGVYSSGWSWSAYAYRLENALRSEIRSKLKEARDKEPLVYVYLVVDDAVYGAPVSPLVNAEAIGRLAPLTKTDNRGVFSSPIEITGRQFGLSVVRAPSLGENVAIAVLRSET